MNSNELFALQIGSLIGHNYIYQIERIASQLLSSPPVIILQERANACSISEAVSRTPKYPLWFISSLNNIFSIFLIFPHAEASSILPPGCGILFCLLYFLYHRELPWNAIFTRQEAHHFPEALFNLLNIMSHLPFAFWLPLHAKQSLSFQEFHPDAVARAKGRYQLTGLQPMNYLQDTDSHVQL